MSREYDRRAAVLESLRAGKSPSEIIAWFGYNKSFVYNLAKKFKESAPAHKARKTQSWLYDNLHHHWSPDLWPPSSPDCNPLDYYVWGIVEAKVNETHHNKDSLKASITQVLADLDRKEVKRACSRFRSRLQQVVAADGGYIE